MLSTTSKYAVRALVELARSPSDARVLGHDLAAKAELPPNYLSKILVSLGRAGFVNASRGSHGGYRLDRRSDRLTLLEVVELFDGPQRKSPCLLRPGHDCSSEKPCAAHLGWSDLWEHYLRYLTTTTISDLARRPEDAGSRFVHAEPPGPANKEEKQVEA